MTGKGNKRALLAVLALVWMLAFLLTACSSGSDNDSAAAPMADRAEAPAAAAANEAKGEALPVQKSAASVAFGESKSSSGSTSSSAGDASGASADSKSLAAEGPSWSAVDSGIGAIADGGAGFNRKMVYTADVTLKAADARKAEDRIGNAITQSQAFIVKFADTKNGDEIGAAYVIKVPSSGFSSFLDRLQQIPNKGFERQLQGNDVTEEYVDLQARLNAKQAVEARLLAFMDKATRSSDLVQFSNELGSVQQEIEQIKGRMRYLDQNVAYSTVNLTLTQLAAGASQEEGEGNGAANRALGSRLSEALLASANVLGRIGEGVLTVVAALLPVLLVVAIVGLPLAWAVRRSRTAAKLKAAVKRRQLNAAFVANGTGMTAHAAEPSEPSEPSAPALNEDDSIR
jgi:hypothetical protein